MAKRFQSQQDALRSLRNFVHEYNREASGEAMDLLYEALEDPVLLLDEERKERILNFLESMDEVVPAIYELDLGKTPNFN